MIEKLDGLKVSQERTPFTMHLNYVCQNITNMDALALWCYLTTLPPQWCIYKCQLMEHFDIGVNKLDAALAYLNKYKLIEYVRQRNADGTLGSVSFLVKCGYEFEQAIKDEKAKATPIKIIPVDGSTTGMETIGMETMGMVNSSYKETTNKERKKKKHSCSSGDEPLIFFDEFWKAFPRKQKKIEAQRIWRKQRLDRIAETILADVIKRHDVYWRHKQKDHIPMPSTYLNGQGWTDELIEPAQKVNLNQYTPQNRPEQKSTVGWFSDNH